MRACPTTNQRIVKAALKSGPKFSTAQLYLKLNKSVPMLELGARLARIPEVRKTEEVSSDRTRVWEIIEGEQA